MATKTPEPRKGMPDPRLTEAEFRARYLQQFTDPAFRPLDAELERIVKVAWDGYDNHRKAPVTRKAGPEFADPDYDLSVDWLAGREAVLAAQARHEDKTGPKRFLIINCSSRSEHTCPGEMSKSWRFAEMALDIFQAADDADVKVLDLSRLSSEYGRNIHPCKACFSTAAALCHWPCSCYPNHSLGQTQDWMNEIYPMWVEAHGIMIITPVNWYQVSSPLKLMMDRLAPMAAIRIRPAPRARTRRRPRRSSWRAGTIPATSRAGCSPAWCMAMSKARRTCAGRSTTGCASWTCARPGPAHSSTATSATGSPTPPATASSMLTPPCRRR
jgi:hypothetical protein